MNDLLGNFLLEIGLFTFLGILYYFYQKRKIVHYEANKVPIVMNMILQACLTDKTEEPSQELDSVIEALDDFLQSKSTHPPLALLKKYSEGPRCSPELKGVIVEGILEIEPDHGKK